MDLAQTVSHLAAANLELTNVHKRTLGYLEAICLDNHHSRKIKRKTKRKVRKRDELQTNENSRIFSLEEENRKHLEELSDAKKEINELKKALQLGDYTTTEKRLNDEMESSGSKEGVSSNSSVLNEEFKRELLMKREARQRAIAAVSSEMERLRSELEAEKSAHSETKVLLEKLKGKVEEPVEEKINRRTQEQLEALRLSDLLKISDEIINDMWLQLERTDDLRFQLETDPEEHRLRISSLKRLSDETRASIKSRKKQINALKDRLAQILVRLGDRNFLDMGDDIRDELERQIEDVGRSRNLSDERCRILGELKDNSLKELHQVKAKMENTKKNVESLEEELQKTEEKLYTRDSEIINLESQLGLTKADCRDLENQMSVINNLFSQMLLGASSAEMDLDRLTQLLQENHDLISGMAKENGREAAALPKLLLDIIKQVEDGSNINTNSSSSSLDSEEKKEDDESLAEESIAHNLPKVWRVLLELLSCHAANTSAVTSASESSASDSCYKSVDTPAGPRLVISVSKTYIRLKELILEKKHVEKEMNRMKQLNSHLESKLSEQEKRLLTVTDELSKTWNIVGRMQAQHQQLHTHEKILRYELQQKRKMLQELKQELEYCREKWESARQKNSKTEIEWKSLRREFAARKAANHSDSFNHSGESGFSDERDEETDEEDERTRPISSRKRADKNSILKVFQESESVDTSPDEEKTEIFNNSGEKSLNSLDKALTSVIRNLISKDQQIESDSTTSVSKNDEINDPPNSNEAGNLELSNSQKVDNMQLNEECDLLKTDPEPNQVPDDHESGLPKTDSQATESSQSEITNEAEKLVLQDAISEPNTPKNNDLQPSKESSEIPNIEIKNLQSSEESILPKYDQQTLQSSSQSKEEPRASCSKTDSENKPELILDARAQRLKRLEEQASWLVKKMSATNRRGNELSTRLGELHEAYGSTPTPPPMPDVLPNFRLQTEDGESSSEKN